MSRRSTSLAAITLTVATYLPASAAPVDPIGERSAGFSCGASNFGNPFDASKDPTTSVVMTGGPFVAVGAASVTVTCSISFGAGRDVSCSETLSGPVGAVLCVRTFDTPPWFVYLCTQVSWTYSETTINGRPVITPGAGSWQGYLNDPDGNPFCDLIVS